MGVSFSLFSPGIPQVAYARQAKIYIFDYVHLKRDATQLQFIPNVSPVIFPILYIIHHIVQRSSVQIFLLV